MYNNSICKCTFEANICEESNNQNSIPSKMSTQISAQDKWQDSKPTAIEKKRIVGSSQAERKSCRLSIPDLPKFLDEWKNDCSESFKDTNSSSSSSVNNVIRAPVFKNDEPIDLDLLLKNGKLSLEVVGEGTKLMKSIGFPTVIAKIGNTKLQNSMIYYVILETKAEEFDGELLALMLISPYCPESRSEFAELLPLCLRKSETSSELFSLKPMLPSERYNSMFCWSCSFKIKSIKSGRRIDWSDECPWNVWNLRIKELKTMMAEVIWDDIRKIPVNMVRTLRPLKRNETFRKCRFLSENVSRLSESLKTVALTEESCEPKLSDHCNTLKFTGLTARGGSSFVDWFQAIPPNVHVDQNFKCSGATILTKDTFSDTKGLDKYLCVSENV